jgi:hypothetical protein
MVMLTSLLNRNVRGALSGAGWADSAQPRLRFGYGYNGIDIADDPRSGGMPAGYTTGQSYARGAAPG